MIEVFKTDVCAKGTSRKLSQKLKAQFPYSKISFDLEDCDKILRIEGRDFCTNCIIELLNLNGHFCEVLT